MKKQLFQYVKNSRSSLELSNNFKWNKGKKIHLLAKSTSRKKRNYNKCNFNSKKKKNSTFCGGRNCNLHVYSLLGNFLVYLESHQFHTTKREKQHIEQIVEHCIVGGFRDREVLLCGIIRARIEKHICNSVLGNVLLKGCILIKEVAKSHYC